MDRLKNQCKKYLGLKPYNDPTNFVKGDGIFYKSIEEEFGKEQTQEMIKKLKEGERPTWQETFFEIAKTVAKRSKDPRTKVGCVLVKNNCIVATGYNGDPRNFRYKFNWNTEEKYNYVIHAELNTICNAVYNGAGNSIKDGEIYLTLSPCHDCIKILIQMGIKKVYYLEEYKDFELTKQIADNAEIELIKVEVEE